MSVTTDTRFQSMAKLNRNKLYGYLISLLKNCDQNEGMTARECAIALYNQGKIHENSRQATAPRLTELEDMGVVQIIGKKYDEFTDRFVASYALAS